jgi:hypothetical protein
MIISLRSIFKWKSVFLDRHVAVHKPCAEAQKPSQVVGTDDLGSGGRMCHKALRDLSELLL